MFDRAGRFKSSAVSSPKVIGKGAGPGIAVLVLLLAYGSAGAQEVQLQPVSLTLKREAAESTFSRARRVAVTTDHSAGNHANAFSFDHASVFEKTAFELINQARTGNGLAPLIWDAELCRLARAHSEDMARRRFFDHETPEGLRPKERARALEIRFRVIAENIAYNKGYADPAALAVDRWMNSSGHRANILYNGFQYSAIGTFVSSDGSVFLTQIFIAR